MRTEGEARSDRRIGVHCETHVVRRDAQTRGHALNSEEFVEAGTIVLPDDCLRHRQPDESVAADGVGRRDSTLTFPRFGARSSATSQQTCDPAIVVLDPQVLSRWDMQEPMQTRVVVAGSRVAVSLDLLCSDRERHEKRERGRSFKRRAPMALRSLSLPVKWGLRQTRPLEAMT